MPGTPFLPGPSYPTVHLPPPHPNSSLSGGPSDGAKVVEVVVVPVLVCQPYDNLTQHLTIESFLFRLGVCRAAAMAPKRAAGAGGKPKAAGEIKKDSKVTKKAPKKDEKKVEHENQMQRHSAQQKITPKLWR